MQWYFGLNEAAVPAFSDVSKMAVLSCLERTSLKPNCIFDGNACDFTRWLEAHGTRVHFRVVPFLQRILDSEHVTGLVPSIARGAYLRVLIPEIENGDCENVLYTDADVLFLKDVVQSLSRLKPRFLAAAPGRVMDNFAFFSSGVMLLNIRNMKKSLPGFLEFIDVALPKLMMYGPYDQGAYNYFYRGVWDRLPPEFNWKPYWGWNEKAEILHFHGARPSEIETYLTHLGGTATLNESKPSTERILRRIEKDRAQYESCLRVYLNTREKFRDEIAESLQVRLSVSSGRYLCILVRTVTSEPQSHGMAFDVEVDGDRVGRVWFAGAKTRLPERKYEQHFALPPYVMDGSTHEVVVKRAFSDIAVARLSLVSKPDLEKRSEICKGRFELVPLEQFVNKCRSGARDTQDVNWVKRIFNRGRSGARDTQDVEPVHTRQEHSAYRGMNWVDPGSQEAFGGDAEPFKAGAVVTAKLGQGGVISPHGLVFDTRRRVAVTQYQKAVQRTPELWTALKKKGNTINIDLPLHDCDMLDEVCILMWPVSSPEFSWHLEVLARLNALARRVSIRQGRFLTGRLTDQQLGFMALVGIESRQISVIPDNVVVPFRSAYVADGAGCFIDGLNAGARQFARQAIGAACAKHAVVLLRDTSCQSGGFWRTLSQIGSVRGFREIDTATENPRTVAEAVCGASVCVFTDPSHWAYLLFAPAQAHVMDLAESEQAGGSQLRVKLAGLLGLGYTFENTRSLSSGCDGGDCGQSEKRFVSVVERIRSCHVGMDGE